MTEQEKIAFKIETVDKVLSVLSAEVEKTAASIANIGIGDISTIKLVVRVIRMFKVLIKEVRPSVFEALDLPVPVSDKISMTDYFEEAKRTL